MRDRFEAAAQALGGGPFGGGGFRGGALPLDAQARLVGVYRWMERRLFEVLGSWVASEAVPEAQVLFDTAAQQHAWHAELFADRLPALDSVDTETLTVPPGAEVDRMFASLAGALRADDDERAADDGTLMGRPPGSGAPSGGTLLRLVGLGRVVLPRLVAGYGLHLRRVSLVAEAPLGRALRLVLRDEIEQWQAVETLTQALLRRPHDIAVVTAHQQQLEGLVADTGAGLVPWPAAGGPAGRLGDER